MYSESNSRDVETARRQALLSQSTSMTYKCNTRVRFVLHFQDTSYTVSYHSAAVEHGVSKSGRDQAPFIDSVHSTQTSSSGLSMYYSCSTSTGSNNSNVLIRLPVHNHSTTK